jgi:hypothetical protein
VASGREIRQRVLDSGAQRRRWRRPDLERVAAVQGLASLPSSPCMAGARIWVYASRGGEGRRGEARFGGGRERARRRLGSMLRKEGGTTARVTGDSG